MKITVVINSLPMNTSKNSEALRMSVGLTLRGDKVSVVFIDDGVYSITKTNPEIIGLNSVNRELEALILTKCELFADKPSIEKRNIREIVDNIKIVEHEEIFDKITESDITIAF